MKQKNKLARVLLVIIVLALAALACIEGGGGGIGPEDATATFGAQVFSTEVSAIATYEAVNTQEAQP